MLVLWAGLIIFIGGHAIPVYPSLKMRIKDIIGVAGYHIIFSIVSTLGLALIIYGYALARENPLAIDPLYTSPKFLKPITLLLMIPVFILVIASCLPGKMTKKLKYPFFIAIKIWAIAHLLVNGNTADVILFISFLFWAVLGMIAAKKRENLNLDGTIVTYKVRNDIIAVACGLAFYVIFMIWLHELLIGISPVAAG